MLGGHGLRVVRRGKGSGGAKVPSVSQWEEVFINAWTDPERRHLIVWEPHAVVGFHPDTDRPIRGRHQGCRSCRASWDTFCAAECDAVEDPWNPKDNPAIRRYFE